MDPCQLLDVKEPDCCSNGIPSCAKDAECTTNVCQLQIVFWFDGDLQWTSDNGYAQYDTKTESTHIIYTQGVQPKSGPLTKT